MKLDKFKLKKKKDHQEKIADYLVNVHIKNEQLRKKLIDVSVLSKFKVNTNQTEDK